jgi:hypothetical protein
LWLLGALTVTNSTTATDFPSLISATGHPKKRKDSDAAFREDQLDLSGTHEEPADNSTDTPPALCCRLVKMLLKSHEHLAYLFRHTKVGYPEIMEA